MKAKALKPQHCAVSIYSRTQSIQHCIGRVSILNICGSNKIRLPSTQQPAWLISYRRHLETGPLHSGLTTIGHHTRFESTRFLPAVIITGQVYKLLQNSEKIKGEHQAGNQTETCQAVISNVKKPCDVVIEQNGRHVEHVL